MCLGKCGEKTTVAPSTTVEEETTTTPEPTKPPRKEVDIPEKKKQDQVAVAGAGPGVTDFVHVPTLAPSTHFIYDVVLRIANQKWNPELEDVTSQAHLKMANLIQKEVS